MTSTKESTTNSNIVSASKNDSTTPTTTKTSVSSNNITNTQTVSTNSNIKTESKDSVKISVNNATLHPYEKYTITATVISGNKYVTEGIVAFKINGKTIAHQKVVNGKATITYMIPELAAKTYTVTAIYGGTSSLKSTKTTGTLKINKYSVTGTITGITAESGKTTTFKAVLKTNTGAFVKNGTVAFKINGKTIGHTTVTQGVATLKYKIPPGWDAKTYTISLVYGSTKLYSANTLKGLLNVKYGTTSAVTSVTTTAGNTASFKTIVKTNNGATVKSGTVAFKINGKTIGHATVTNGVATLSYTIPPGWSAKTYNITAIYSGSTQYTATTSTNKLTVTSKTVVPAGYEKYVVATNNCQVKSTTIQNLAKKITNGKTTTYQKAVAIFIWVRNNTGYKPYYQTKLGALGLLNERWGNCVDMTHLTLALMRAAGIPGRYVHARGCVFSSMVSSHIWGEVYVNGKWYVVDATSNRNTFGVIKNWYGGYIVGRYIQLPF